MPIMSKHIRHIIAEVWPIPGGIRWTRAIAMAFLMSLLMMPSAFLMAGDCPMAARERENQAQKSCCPDSREQTESNETSREKSGCFSCYNCGCVYTPFSGRPGSVPVEATVPVFDLSQFAPPTSILFVPSFHFEKTALPRPPLPAVPVYLLNQVFLN